MPSIQNTSITIHGVWLDALTLWQTSSTLFPRSDEPTLAVKYRSYSVRSFENALERTIGYTASIPTLPSAHDGWQVYYAWACARPSFASLNVLVRQQRKYGAATPVLNWRILKSLEEDTCCVQTIRWEGLSTDLLPEETLGTVGKWILNAFRVQWPQCYWDPPF